VSRSGDQAYYDLRPFVEKARAETGGDAEARKERTRRALLPLYRGGFYPESEFPDAGFGHLCRRSGEMYLTNVMSQPRTVCLTMKVGPPDPANPAPLKLRVGGDLWTQDAEIDSAGETLTRTLYVPPGRHVIRLESEPPPGRTSPNAPAFRLTNVTCEEE